MNRSSYDRLPADVRDALDSISGDAWVAKFGPYWDKWDKPVRDRANEPGHEVVVPDTAKMAQWKAALSPVTERYLATLSAHFANARATYEKVIVLTGARN
jgi:TRAP-type C4-dicarboxylate transport system substrate-binding protein